MTDHSNHDGFVLPLYQTSRFSIPVLLAAAIERFHEPPTTESAFPSANILS